MVMRAYPEEKYIGRLLEGIRHQTLRQVQIPRVASGSTDATAVLAAQKSTGGRPYLFAGVHLQAYAEHGNCHRDR